MSEYESPITIIAGELQMKMESKLLWTASRTVGYHIDKDELIKALKYDRGQYEKGYNDGLNADKWISTSVRLPEKGEDVLLYYPKWEGHEIQVGYLDCDGLTFEVCGEFNFSVGEVTHWQPLPQMPQEAIIVSWEE